MVTPDEQVWLSREQVWHSHQRLVVINIRQLCTLQHLRPDLRLPGARLRPRSFAGKRLKSFAGRSAVAMKASFFSNCPADFEAALRR